MWRYLFWPCPEVDDEVHLEVQVRRGRQEFEPMG
jgi:hypothetical protein